jgi:SAM-dependent methyltransferase
MDRPPIDRNRIERILHKEGVSRPVDEVIAQYEYERAMAQRLLSAAREERRKLYGEVYDNLFKQFPTHPELTQQNSPKRRVELKRRLDAIKRLLSPQTKFAEIGAGDCEFAKMVASQVEVAYALEVSFEKVLQEEANGGNLALVPFDGLEIPLPNEYIDIAYSNQVLEHLHPEDALEHLREVHRILKPGGYYLCVTPHRFTGPSDVSRYFTREATALHLKEYTYEELYKKFHQVGFLKVWGYTPTRKIPIHFVPVVFNIVIERMIAPLPYSLRKKVAIGISRSRVFYLSQVSIIGKK